MDQIMQIKKEIYEIEHAKIIEKINGIKTWFFEKKSTKLTNL